MVCSFLLLLFFFFFLLLLFLLLLLHSLLPLFLSPKTFDPEHPLSPPNSHPDPTKTAPPPHLSLSPPRTTPSPSPWNFFWTAEDGGMHNHNPTGAASQAKRSSRTTSFPEGMEAPVSGWLRPPLAKPTLAILILTIFGQTDFDRFFVDHIDGRHLVPNPRRSSHSHQG